jgi:hypothetical protein
MNRAVSTLTSADRSDRGAGNANIAKPCNAIDTPTQAYRVRCCLSWTKRAVAEFGYHMGF